MYLTIFVVFVVLFVEKVEVRSQSGPAGDARGTNRNNKVLESLKLFDKVQVKPLCVVNTVLNRPLWFAYCELGRLRCDIILFFQA